MALRTYLRRWWLVRSRETAPPTTYEVACRCGRLLQGKRRWRSQVVPCPSCGQPVFILPRSNWPVRAGAVPPVPATPGSDLALPVLPPARMSWRMPVLAALLTVLLIVALYVQIWPYLPRREHTAEGSPPPPAPKSLEARVEEGRRALADGNFRLAWERVRGAVELRDRQRPPLPPEENRQLNQLHRQSELLARLLSHSLEEIVQQAAQVRQPEEWQAQFNDYRGKSVLFEDVIRLDPANHPVLSFYEVRTGEPGGKVRVALEDLTLFRHLPLTTPQPMLFGARLAGVGREEGGIWVVRFEPDSGVLLTDRGAASACCPPARSEAERDEVLRRQQDWLRLVPDLPPAGP